MSRIRAPLLVGLLVVGAAFASFYALERVDKSITKGDETIAVTAVFSDVTGMAEKTRVTLAGYPVGQVQAIELEGSVARVRLRILKKVTMFSGIPGPDGRLASAATLVRRQASLLGDYYLELAPGASGEALGEGDEIPVVVTSTGLEAALSKLDSAAEIIPKIDRIAGDISRITDNLAAVLGTEKGQRRLDEIADNVVKASRDMTVITSDLKDRFNKGSLARGGSLDKTIASLERFARTAESFAAVASSSGSRTLRNVEEVSVTLRDLVGKNSKGVESTMGTLTSTLKKLEESLVRMDKAVAHVESIVAKVDEGKGTAGRLINDSKLVDKAEEVIGDASKLVRRFTSIETGLSLRTEFMQKADAFKSHVTLRISPRNDKDFLLSLTDDPRGKTRNTRLVTTSTLNQGVSSTLQESTTETSDSLKISLLYQLRWNWFRARFGMIESSAGTGFDLTFLGDALWLSVDAFAFGSGNLPRVRSALNWEFIRHVYAYAGVDSWLDSKAREPYFGLGVRFTDDDIQTLLLTAPRISSN